jgi:hypothetical protein
MYMAIASTRLQCFVPASKPVAQPVSFKVQGINEDAQIPCPQGVHVGDVGHQVASIVIYNSLGTLIEEQIHAQTVYLGIQHPSSMPMQQRSNTDSTRQSAFRGTVHAQKCTACT